MSTLFWSPDFLFPLFFLRSHFPTICSSVSHCPTCTACFALCSLDLLNLSFSVQGLNLIRGNCVTVRTHPQICKWWWGVWLCGAFQLTLHYIAFSWCFYPKWLSISAFDQQDTNLKKTESYKYIRFHRAKTFQVLLNWL